MVGVSKVGPDNFFDCICEGTSSQTQPSHTFRPTSDTPPVSFADSPLGEGAWIYWIFANLMTLPSEREAFKFVVNRRTDAFRAKNTHFVPHSDDDRQKYGKV